MRAVVTAAAVFAVLFAAGSAAADVRVQQMGELISVHATAAPVNDVLDRLARQTGMQVLYEGAPPRLPVTLTIERRSVAEAVFSLLDGLGLNYALRLDEGGARVVTLVMTGGATPPSAGQSADPARGVHAGGAVPPYPPPPSYPQEGGEEFDDGVIPPPPPQPPQEFVVTPPVQQDQQPQQQAPQQFSPASLGSGFSSPFGGGGFSSPSVFGTPTQGTPATPPPQFVPEPPPEEKEPE